MAGRGRVIARGHRRPLLTAQMTRQDTLTIEDKDDGKNVDVFQSLSDSLTKGQLPGGFEPWPPRSPRLPDKTYVRYVTRVVLRNESVRRENTESYPVSGPRRLPTFTYRDAWDLKGSSRAPPPSGPTRARSFPYQGHARKADTGTQGP
ncbi:hypothetical protein E2C01_012184 [Portunus trituberculatus]|uniref:Uncharacterized protein n=1 Tax=Portunus trituberculatus TaxID=210409 RepID=A0A5B7DCU7_PORTR|nr:hypothetical protein [Portunus trituberculatus]